MADKAQKLTRIEARGLTAVSLIELLITAVRADERRPTKTAKRNIEIIVAELLGRMKIKEADMLAGHIMERER